MYKSGKSAPPPSPLDSGDRVVSLDALRGFDMIWILGADELTYHARGESRADWLDTISTQLHHSGWIGFSFYDLIFPLFIFMAGASLVFSLSKVGGDKSAAVKRILIRFFTLFLLGVLYNGGFSKPWPDIRLMGVLQRIALCYLAASLLFLYCPPRTLAIVTASILLLYWAAMKLIPVPGVGRGDLSQGHNLADYLDQKLLPGKLYRGDYDPEGLFSTLPAIATCLLGVFAGLLLRGPSVPWKKVVILLLGGALAVAVGMAWGGMFPELAFLKPLQFAVIKKIWTSSYVLVAGGWSAILLGVFYLLIDVWQFRTWAMPFVWLGMNAITLYLVHNFFDFGGLASRLVGGDIARALGRGAGTVHAAVSVLLVMLLARFLYKRGVFVRV